MAGVVVGLVSMSQGIINIVVYFLSEHLNSQEHHSSLNAAEQLSHHGNGRPPVNKSP